MNIEWVKNTLREFQAENRQKFKNTQAEFKKAVSYKKKVYDQSRHIMTYLFKFLLESSELKTLQKFVFVLLPTFFQLPLRTLKSRQHLLQFVHVKPELNKPYQR